jgi:hypothetical protein
LVTSAKIRNGSTYLDNHLSANDYYAQGERVKGEWLGKGAESLGLSGEVHPEAFEALRINLRPGTGERLTPRTKETRQPTLAEAAQAFLGKGRPIRQCTRSRQFSPFDEADFKSGSVL